MFRLPYAAGKSLCRLTSYKRIKLPKINLLHSARSLSTTEQNNTHQNTTEHTIDQHTTKDKSNINDLNNREIKIINMTAADFKKHKHYFTSSGIINNSTAKPINNSFIKDYIVEIAGNINDSAKNKIDKTVKEVKEAKDFTEYLVHKNLFIRAVSRAIVWSIILLILAIIVFNELGGYLFIGAIIAWLLLA